MCGEHGMPWHGHVRCISLPRLGLYVVSHAMSNRHWVVEGGCGGEWECPWTLGSNSCTAGQPCQGMHELCPQLRAWHGHA